MCIHTYIYAYVDKMQACTLASTCMRMFHPVSTHMHMLMYVYIYIHSIYLDILRVYMYGTPPYTYMHVCIYTHIRTCSCASNGICSTNTYTQAYSHTLDPSSNSNSLHGFGYRNEHFLTLDN